MKRLSIVLALWLAAWAAYAQTPLVYPAPFAPIGNTVPLSVSSTSSNVQLGWVGVVGTSIAPSTAWVCNTGSTNAYVLLGIDNTVTATTSTGFNVVNGQCNALRIQIPTGTATYIAAVTASSTTTMTIATGNGSPLAKRIGPSIAAPLTVLATGTSSTDCLSTGTSATDCLATP